MTYSTMLVHLDGCGANEPVLALTANLAEQYKAQVIGIAACQPMQIGTAGGDFTGGLAVLERDIVDDELKRAAAEFRACVELQALCSNGVRWRRSSPFHTPLPTRRGARIWSSQACARALRATR